MLKAILACYFGLRTADHRAAWQVRVEPVTVSPRQNQPLFPVWRGQLLARSRPEAAALRSYRFCSRVVGKLTHLGKPGNLVLLSSRKYYPATATAWPSVHTLGRLQLLPLQGKEQGPLFPVRFTFWGRREKQPQCVGPDPEKQPPSVGWSLRGICGRGKIPQEEEKDGGKEEEAGEERKDRPRVSRGGAAQRRTGCVVPESGACRSVPLCSSSSGLHSTAAGAADHLCTVQLES